MKPRKGAASASSGTAKNESPDEILTRDEVAAWLKIAPRDVVRYGIPCIRMGRKTLRYFRSDVIAWLAEHRK